MQGYVDRLLDSQVPRYLRSFPECLVDVEPERTRIVAPVSESYPIAERVTVAPIGGVLEEVAQGTRKQR